MINQHHLKGAIICMSFLGILFSFLYYKASNQASNFDFSGFQMMAARDRFIYKNDIIVYASGGYDINFLRQAYQAYLVMKGESLASHDELVKKATQDIQSRQDYDNKVKIDELASSNGYVADNFKVAGEIQKEKSIFFMLLIISQIFNAVFGASLFLLKPS